DECGEGSRLTEEQIRGDADDPFGDKLSRHGGSLRGAAIGWSPTRDCLARKVRSHHVFLSESEVGMTQVANGQDETVGRRGTAWANLRLCRYPGRRRTPGRTPEKPEPGGASAMPIDRFDLTGRTALVTGGSKGLGQAMAHALAQAGADVVITARHADELEEG